MMRFIALLLAFAVLPAFAQDPARVVKPEIRVGDSWTYRTTNLLGPGTQEQTLRVGFVDAKTLLVVSTTKGEGKEYDSSWTPEWNAVTAQSGMMFRPNSGLLRFPLRLGDKHEVNYELLRPRANIPESATSGTSTVAGWETIEVPAGKFRAVRIELDTMVRSAEAARAFPRRATFWYVPEVRRWVKFQVTTPKFTGVEELIEYKLNED